MRIIARPFKDKIRAWLTVWDHERKLRWAILGMGLIIALCLGGVLLAMLGFNKQLVGMNNALATREDVEAGRKKSEETEKDLQASIDRSTTLNKEFANALRQANPKLPVPKIVEEAPLPSPTPSPEPNRKPRLVIELPSKPKVTPAPKVKTKIKRVYLTKPKDWPFWKPWPPKK